MTDTIFPEEYAPNSTGSGEVSTDRSVGMVWQTSAAGKAITSGRYWVPALVGIGTGTLYQIWDGSELLVEVDLNTAIPSPTLDDWNDVPLPDPIPVEEDHDYTVCAYLLAASSFRYSFGMTLPITSGGTVSASTSVFGEDDGPDVPPTNTGFTGGAYPVDVNVDDADAGVEVSGTTGGAALATATVQKVAIAGGKATGAAASTAAAKKLAVSSSTTGAVAGATSQVAKTAIVHATTGTAAGATSTVAKTAVAAGKAQAVAGATCATTKTVGASGQSSAIAGATVQVARVAFVTGRCLAFAGGYRAPATSNVVTRPFTGTVTRPFTGIVTRP